VSALSYKQQQVQEMIKRVLRAIIYCRVSTDKQEQDGESLEYQEEKCRKYAELHGIEVVIVLKEAKSGFIHYSHREQLTLARQMIRDGLADMIIVWDLRRFSRNFVHSAMIFEEIESAGGEIVSVSENIDNSLTGKLIRSILAWSAESEREKILEYANRHWQKRHELNMPMATSTPPYGWQWGDKDKTFFVLNLEEAAVRRSIFEMFVEMDMSIRQIGHKLTMDGIPCPRDARFMVRDSEDEEVIPEEEEEAISEEAASPKYHPWSRATISTYLRDVANIGTLIICKKKRVLQEDGSTKGIVHPDQKIIPGAMPPIVSPEMFERTQRKLETNRETKSHRPKNVEDYLLASHVFCALCGNRMHTIAEKGVRVYRCNKHMSIYDTGREPHILRIKTGHIDPVVWEDCCQVFERLSLIQDVLERSIEQSLQNMLEDTRGREMIDALQQEFAFAMAERNKHPEGSYYYKLINQDVIQKEQQLRKYEEEFVHSQDVVKLSGVYQQSIMGFLDFLNTMQGRYNEATFQEMRNAIDVLGVRVYVSPRPDLDFTKPIIETDKEWLNITEISTITGIHRNSLMLHVHKGTLQSEKMIIQRIIIHRDEVQRYLDARNKTFDLSQYDDEWFTLHRLAALKISNHRLLHQAIDRGEIKYETRGDFQTFVHRDVLNQFLTETPIRQRGVYDTVPPKHEITYSPLFTGVHASKGMHSRLSTLCIMQDWQNWWRDSNR